MAELFAPVCSISTTRRRRYLWAAWWTAAPTRTPFRKPDAHNGGARTREEALREAQAAAGVRLVEIESRWARAWARVLIGQPPWTPGESDNDGGTGAQQVRPRVEDASSIWAILGVATPGKASARLTPEELKRAFHKRALETHPDRGGDPTEFQKVQRAYEEATRRVKRRGGK